MVTGDEKGLKVVTRGYKRLQGLQWVTGGDNGLQRVTRGYRGLQRVTKGYRGLQVITKGYRRLCSYSEEGFF